jgi:hypothetical protein
MRMQYAPPKQYQAATHRALAYTDVIEWETMPSVLDEVVQPRGRPAPDAASARSRVVAHDLHEAWFGETTAWNITMPADLDELPTITPHHHPIDGLDVQEVRDPETFLRYFSSGAAHR